MSERIWHELHICAPEWFDTDFDFSDDQYENDYNNAYDVIMETIAGLSVELALRDESEDIHQVFVELPIKFEEWEDEE